ncbi:MAG: crotonase [Gammaproteobacteria bacterium RIFCSPHIGHO2_12_FULL_35_23]|nr:MAG: crotonase [Gammaproteobacteria bacterium RIFCSPHIGHO2_12_FULL_35_23]
MTEYNHWQIEKNKSGIVWLLFNRQGLGVNTFNVEALTEFDKILDRIYNDKDCMGVIIGSAKKASFIAGADIEQFIKVKDEAEAYEFIKKAHDIFNKLEALKVPTVAMINGVCLGGGTEMALSCNYRVMVSDEPKAKIGLPEIMLGIFPGWGGSVRLPRLIGSISAMDLMLTGRAIDAKKAERVGMIDVAVPARHLKRAAEAYIVTKPAKHKPSNIQKLTNAEGVRKILASKMRKQVASNKVSQVHYPAPYALIANWEKYGVSNKAFEGEARAVSSLVVGSTAQNLIRVFFLQQRLKGMGKGVNFKVKHVHVIGAGTMGGDIAAWCALQGMTVTLQDREAKFIAPAIKRAAKLYEGKLKKPELVQEVLDRLIPDVQGNGVKQADLVIEAIFEDLKVKQALFKDLEVKMKPGAVMATNTSSIPLDEINQVLNHPERLVGIHFFNPVAKMPLVEIVYGQKTDETVKQHAIAFVRAIDRLPLPVKSEPGFLVNRILMPYLLESLNLYQEGVSPTLIDKAAVKFGMPMGPVELADKVGLDVCLHVAKNLSIYFGTEVPEFLEKKVAAGELGVKSGKGFYQYSAKGKPIKPEIKGVLKLTEQEIADRLILRYLNEAAACLREGIVEDSDLLDAGMIFGTGFAPFRGGPMHYAKQEGFEVIANKLKEFETRFSKYFKPDSEWQVLINKNE